LLKFNPSAGGGTFVAYLLLDAALEASCILLYFRALQVSPLSLCIPFIAFTPLFLIPAGYVITGEMPSAARLIGAVPVVIGSLAMNRQLFAVSWMAPFQTIVREEGSRYVLIVAALYSITNPIGKKLVLLSHAYTLACLKGVIYCLLFGTLAAIKGQSWRKVVRSAPWWLVAAGILEGVVLRLQFSALNNIDVVIAISLKRAGIVLALLMGWLVFRERDVADKLVASCVMVAGALMFYPPMSMVLAAGLGGLTLAGMAATLRLTQKSGKRALKKW
jgi:uncharacterized membrane protein